MATKRSLLEGLKRSEDHRIVQRQQDVRRGALETGNVPPDPSGCLGKADLDEPLFILRAQDRCAPFAVRAWAERARGAGAAAEKVAEAMEVAQAMETWQELTGRSKWPD